VKRQIKYFEVGATYDDIVETESDNVFFWFMDKAIPAKDFSCGPVFIASVSFDPNLLFKQKEVVSAGFM
jgi:hypothetical protein